MAKLRRKLRLALNLYETTNSNRLKTGDPLTCELYPAGVEVEGSVNLNGGLGATTQVTVSGRGAIPTGATAVRVYRQDGSGIWQDIAGNDLHFTAIEEELSAEGVFVVTLTNQGSTTAGLVEGDRILAYRTAANLIDIYYNETDPTDTITQPIDVPESGVVEGYVDVRGVDVYVSGTSIDNNWYAFNVPTGSGEIGPMRLKSESLAANTLVNLDADTSVAIFTSNAATVQSLEHCAPGRLLILYAATSGVQLASFATKADNTVYEATPRTISITQDAPLMLIGQEASANVAYWAPVTQPIQFDLDLDYLSDVSTGGAVQGEVLGYNSGTATWEPVSDLGSSTNPLVSIHVDTGTLSSGGLRIVNGSGFDGVLDSSLLSANKLFYFPNIGFNSAELMATSGNQSISGTKSFVASTFQLVASTSIATFDASLISSGTTRTFSFPNKSGTFALTSDLPTGINSIADVTITGATTDDLLKWSGTAWVNTKSIGSSANPITSIVLSENALKIDDGASAYQADFDIGETMTADRTVSLTDDDGVMVLDERNWQMLTVEFGFDDSSTTGLFNNLENIVNGALLFRAPASAQCYAVELGRLTAEFMLDAASTAVSGLGIAVAANSVLPSATTKPATAGEYSTLITVPASPLTYQRTSHAISSAPALVPPDDYVYLYLSGLGGTDGPGVSGSLRISMEYRVQLLA